MNNGAAYKDHLEWAQEQDRADPLASFRDRFTIPRGADGSSQIYLCGNSLGLQPLGARQAVMDELDDWAEFAVEGHFRGRKPWMHYHDLVRDDLAQVVGAKPLEVVAMNSLTTNLHLMMASFYRPTATRNAVLIEQDAFPSDRYAVDAQIRWHGHDPASARINLRGDEPEGTVSDQAVLDAIERDGDRIALVMLPGVQYLTGQVFDLAGIVAAARRKGCMVGFDLAHSVGNVELALHDSGADFAVWCHYKYLNSGPGAVAGAFVHERHAHSELPRLAGWWGHDPASRFAMGEQFVPSAGADGWQLSNPPVLALAPLRASLDLFRDAGMAQLRAKSLRLTGYLRWLIERRVGTALTVITPREPQRHGCQLSLRVNGARETGRALFEHLQAAGIIVDWREPDVIRVSPAPLYNRHVDCLTLADAVSAWLAAD